MRRKLRIGVSRKTENPLIYNRMKRYCKNVDITDRTLISRAVYKCLRRKYKRRDTLEYMRTVSGLKASQIYYIIKKYGYQAANWIVEMIIDIIQDEIIRGEISLPPIWYREKIDQSSGKVRRIGIQNVKHQLYDYIAVEAMQPIFRRIGEHQYASIKGRGTLKGARTIRRWLKNRKTRYYVKLDIRKCFESIDHDSLIGFLGKYIKNAPLMRLIETLIGMYEQGVSIGSYLSQYLCNLYLSQLYHYIKEDLYKIRKSKRGDKRKNLVKNALFYMDDILLTGTSSKDLAKACKMIAEKCQEMKLEIKPNYSIRTCDGIDMMGYRIFRTHTEIRKKIFIRVRRAYKKALKHIKTRRAIGVRLARKCLSYYGYLKNTNSRRLARRLLAKETLKICKGVIRNESKIRQTPSSSKDNRLRGKDLCISVP